MRDCVSHIEQQAPCLIVLSDSGRVVFYPGHPLTEKGKPRLHVVGHACDRYDVLQVWADVPNCALQASASGLPRIYLDDSQVAQRCHRASLPTIEATRAAHLSSASRFSSAKP